MSYESEMLQKLKMPVRKAVEKALLKSLFNHNGVIKEFGDGEEIVNEIAYQFNLNSEQRSANLETIYRKENRVKKSNLWHRLLFRAADSLAKQKLVSRPTQTILLTNKREWMLTEEGFSKTLNLLNIPKNQKDDFSIKSYEVEKVVQKFRAKQKPKDYKPFYENREKKESLKLSSIRNRSFRQIVIETYEYKCSICGLKIYSPNLLLWEVEAAHIIPHSNNGRDDIWNGLSLCRFHHWAFDVGWFSLDDDHMVLSSEYINQLPERMGKIWGFDTIRRLLSKNLKVQIPRDSKYWPDTLAIKWHRENIFGKNIKSHG
jgi:5-methylcytosine-specific restriction endonuclease McrA